MRIRESGRGAAGTAGLHIGDRNEELPTMALNPFDQKGMAVDDQLPSWSELNRGWFAD